MSISAKKSGQLLTLFSGFSADQQQALVMTIKAIKADGETEFPYEDLLLLLGGDGDRENQWEELFRVALPLIVESARRCDQIERSLLQEVWEYFLRELNPTVAVSWLSGQETASHTREAIVSEFTKIAETKEGRKSLDARFGKEGFHQLEILLSLLRRPEELEDFFKGWPQEIKDLDEALLLPLRDFNELLLVESPEITPHLLFLVSSYLRNSFHIFRAVEKLTGHSNDSVMVKTELKVVGDALLDQNDVWLEAFSWPKGQLCDPEHMSKQLKSFTNITQGWVSEFDVDPSGPWGMRLAAQRAHCGKIWDEHMIRVEKVIDQVMPRKRGSVTGRQTMPNLNKNIDEQSIVSAENAILLLLASQCFASHGGFQSSKDKVVKLLKQRLEEQGDDLLALLGQKSDQYEQVSAHFSILVRITKAYLGDKDADVLARRSVAAMAA